MPHDLGDTVPLTVTIRDAAGVPVNAGTVALTITLPDLTTTSPPVTNPPAVTGVYAVDYVPTQVGRHSYRFVTTTPATAFPDTFDVRPATPAYIVSLADMKRHLNITGTTDDEKLRGYIEAATEVIEQHLNKAVVARSFSEAHGGGYAIALHHTPVISIATMTPVLTGGTTYLPAEVAFGATTGIVELLNGGALNGPLFVTYVAGMPIIPANYTLAAQIIVGHLWQTQRAAGVGSTAGLAFEGESEFLTGMGFSIPHRALELLGPAMSGIA